MSNNPTICLRCHRCKVTRPRGLCHGCYYEPGVRELFPPIGRQGMAGASGADEDFEPSEEEIEAMIAEQLPTMPGYTIKRTSPFSAKPRFTAPVRATGGRE